MKSDIYDKKYFSERVGYSSSSKHLRNWAKRIQRTPKSVLDVGCGRGDLVKYLRDYHKMEAIGLDWSEEAGKLIPQWFVRHDATKQFPFGDKEFDMAISSDFFEHLEEKDIDFVYSEMKRVARKVICLVSSKQEGTHLVVKPKEWWEEKLKGSLVV